MRTRDKQVNIRMTEKEYNQIKKKADRVKLNMSTYIIKSACDKRITVIEDFRNFHTQLTKIGNNLNQLTVLCHQGKITSPNLKETRKSLDDSYDAVMAVLKKYK
ncbi:plasmid mobilization protein [Rubeoparvulum massiliense]|uniref:plasmid mobilization protein n=1 Tax=Rubeoparvulum massiliense TaxID=1631346 RepID=UPI00065E9347|nr:plasmid mobilization relaxosome protein MobC [Rubeoparvulum massiliense]